ncbi:MAG TPA: hypothetical protein VMV50_03795 [Candidatus Paceibacterota bacterium]|nr:hypothetical protein [Candidatus Paceibacterota bacterium]
MKRRYRIESSVAALAAAFVLFTGYAWLPLRAYADASTTPPTSTTTPPTNTDPPPTTADVTTGDAASNADTSNTVNTNTTTSSTTPANDASTTPPTDLAVTSDNTASTTNRTSASAATGGNAAGGTDTASVHTGDAVASATSVNVINTNIIDSNGLLAYSNLFSALGIDLRGLDLAYFTTPAATTSCSLQSCGGDVKVTTSNTATTTNSVTATADTGGNLAVGGDASVSTGNAYASGNAINVVNSNFIRSNYLLVGINNFGNLGGDITLPGAAFFEQLLAQDAEAASARITNDNTAVVANSTAATADTGGNTASGDGSSSVTTGTALSSATTLNQVNTNLTGGSSVFFLFRVWGQWNGTVQGLPAGMQWTNTPSGIEITSTDGAPMNLGALATGAATTSGSITASTTNTASLTNDVHVYALTGNNEAQGGAASVTTGNAYAAANTVNIVNTNVVGHNWIYAIFNIFGNLNGDIAFGHPDLWLGAVAETENPTAPNSNVTFKFTVANRGDADATGVRLSADFLDGMLHFSGGTTTPSGEDWNLGTIPAGATKEFTYVAHTAYLRDGGSVAVPLTATVTSDETDNNPSDNTDSLTLVVATPGTSGGAGPSFSSDPKFVVTKTANLVQALAPITVNYSVDIGNQGGTAYDAVATDVLRNQAGDVVNQQSWNLGTMNYRDEAKINYGLAFASSTAPGQYTNTVTVTGVKNYPDGYPGSAPFTPVSASYTFTVVAPSAPNCSQYLTSYITPGGQNDPVQVSRLQEFLRETQGESGVSVTGVYDDATIAAVKRFQEKYAADILTPWGYDKPTGLVYYTTEQEINNLECGGRRTFGLSSSEQDEIQSTRSLIAQLEAVVTRTVFSASTASTTGGAATSTATTTITLPPNIEVGLAPEPVAPHRSWLDALLGFPQALMANVFESFHAVAHGLALE